MAALIDTTEVAASTTASTLASPRRGNFSTVISQYNHKVWVESMIEKGFHTSVLPDSTTSDDNESSPPARGINRSFTCILSEYDEKLGTLESPKLPDSEIPDSEEVETDGTDARAIGKQESRLQYLMSKFCRKTMECPKFVSRWERFKLRADREVAGGMAHVTEFSELNERMAVEYQQLILTLLKAKADELGESDVTVLPRKFAEQQIAVIEDHDYVLTDAMREVLMEAFSRFYICDLAPAPFSLAAVMEHELNDPDAVVSVSNHCLQMATNWVKHPPSFLTVVELEELVVLSLFHDVYYFDDFAHHDSRVLELFSEYLHTDVASFLVGGHLHLPLLGDKVKAHSFSSPQEAMEQEWVQMDWYLTMVNMNQSDSPGAVTLPLEFFHHYLGRFLTRDVSNIMRVKN